MDKHTNRIIRQLLQVPFVEKGRDESGADCWGIVLLYYKWKYNVSLPRYDGIYLKQEFPEDGVEDFNEVINPIEDFYEVENPEQDDIVMLIVSGRPVHVGVMIDQNRFIHTYKNRAACIESLKDQKWNGKVESYHRWSNR